MDIKENILETIGNTPLIKINKMASGTEATVLAKLETFNPGNSIKDRMALKMVEDAEKRGDLKPGGTIIECTSGNTGMGLALAAVVKGYKCIFTTNDKQSKEKFDILRAFGAEVIVCPTNVEPDDPRSYYSVAARLSETLPNSYWCNQYDNLSNRQAHYESTGPEIWEQTKGKITHLIVGVGTGGTVSGTAKFLKEKNPNIQIWGIDTYGSVFKKYHETGEFDEKEIYPYITEGIGEDILPKNVDFSVIDHFEKVSDKDGAVLCRRLAREEGIFVGYSGGSAIGGFLQLQHKLKKDDVVVIIFHDHGSRYVGKVFNDDWMRDRGFLEDKRTIGDIIQSKKDNQFIFAKEDDKVRHVLDLMKTHDISQLPIVGDDKKIVGSLSENQVLNFVLENPLKHAEEKVVAIMGKPFPILDKKTPIKELSKYITRDNAAVLTVDDSNNTHIISKYDLIQNI